MIPYEYRRILKRMTSNEKSDEIFRGKFIASDKNPNFEILEKMKKDDFLSRMKFTSKEYIYSATEKGVKLAFEKDMPNMEDF